MAEDLKRFRVACATPGCGGTLQVTALHPRFPTGPFWCARCGALRQHEGDPGVAEPDDHAVTLDELDEDGAVASVTLPLPKKW